MANYCNFVIDVQERQNRSTDSPATFMDKVSRGCGNPRNEVFVLWTTARSAILTQKRKFATFGCPRAKKSSGPRAAKSASLVGAIGSRLSHGWKVYQPHARPLFQRLQYYEHELFQHWDVADGHADLRSKTTSR